MGVLEGKTALITGGSRGIGRAVAERLAREGCRIVINYAGNAEAAQAAVAAVRAAGSDAVAIQGDTSDPASIRALFEAADKAFGGLDILINNAHPGSGRGTITTLDEATIDEQLAILKGYILCMQEGGRRLRDGGAVVNLSTTMTRMSMVDNGLYSSLKAAIDQLGRTLARELAPRGITVNAVAPGRTETDRLKGVPSRMPPGPETPFNRGAEPPEVAEVIAFLVMPAGRWINSQVIFANGGLAWSQ